MDFSLIAEEIALEGLDGITLNALWTRLVDRPEIAGIKLDENYKNYIWSYIRNGSDFKFYCLPEPRPELVIFKYDDFSSEGKCHLPVNTPGDIYSHKMIDQDGVRGCCDWYHERKDVTEEVRPSQGANLMSLGEVSKWGQCFVVVASQKLRNLALMRSTSGTNLGIELYIVLEAVGRARFNGEISKCRYERGLSNPKYRQFGQTTNVFGRVKLLAKYGYVTKQPFTVNYKATSSMLQVRLVHLKRFFRVSKASYKYEMQALNNYLLSKPGHVALFTDVMKDLNLKATFFKKPARTQCEYFHSDVVNFSDYYPKETLETDGKTKNGIEKKIRIVKMIKPFEDEYSDDEDIDDEDDDDDDEDESHTMEPGDVGGKVKEGSLDVDKKKAVPVLGHLLYHQSMVRQVVNAVIMSGERGVLARELRNKLNVDKNAIRYSVGELLKLKQISQIKKAVGRNSPHFLVTNQVAEKWRKEKRMSSIKSEPMLNLSSASGAQDISLLEESVASISAFKEEPTASEEQDEVKQIDFLINKVTITCILERVKPANKSTVKLEDNDRKQARRNFILDQLNQKKIFGSHRNLYLDLLEDEKKQGIKESMCRKSYKRLIGQIFNEGLISYINIYEKTKPDKMVQQMIAHSGMQVQDSKIKEALILSSPYFVRLDGKGALDSQSKEMKKLSESASKPTDEKPAKTPPKTATSKKQAVPPMVSVCKMLDSAAANFEVPAVPKSKRSVYGLLPKFERSKVLHKYLFYILYSYEGKTDVLSQDTKDKLDGPPVYLDVSDWRRFLPPLKKHNESCLANVSVDGVCMIGDLLLYMPLYLFSSITNTTWEVKGLQEMLDDPIKKNYPISYVSRDILNPLLARRSYMTRVHTCLVGLCQFGLLTFGTKATSRELEFVTFYLHKRATILDTRNSQPGYLNTRCPVGETFEKLHYEFKSMVDIDSYWNDLKGISLNSKLGSYSVGDDDKKNHGTMSLIEACQPVPLDQVKEIDLLPGDQRGAAGLDSSLFLHRCNNWIVSTERERHSSAFETLSSKLDMKGVKTSISLNPRKKNKDNELNPGAISEEHKKNLQVKHSKAHNLEKPASRKRKMSSSAHSTVPGAYRQFRCSQKRFKRPKMTSKKIKAGKEVRTVKVDTVDKEARLNMRRQRVYFSPLENGLLLLSQVASCMLSPQTAFCVPSTVVRDILKEYLPESRDKTTGAVKGKMSRLLKEEKFRVHLVTCIAQAQCDLKLIEKYSGKRPRMHSVEMQKQFRMLFDDLWAKFSSSSPEDLFMPSTVAELEECYQVKNTIDILYKTPKLTRTVQNSGDVKEIVAWEFLENLLNLKKPYPSKDIYNTLSCFSDDLIFKAYVTLKTHGIFVRMKKTEKDKIMNANTLLNNHRSSLRHKEALRPKYPVDLFSNTLEQTEQLVGDQSPNISSATNSVSGGTEGCDASGSTKETNHTSVSTLNFDSRDEQRMEVDQPGKDSCAAVNSDNCETVKSRSQLAAEGYKELNINKLQGGSVLAVLTLLALDWLNMKVVIPDEMVKLDEEGKRKLFFFKKPGTGQDTRKRALEEDSDEDWTGSKGEYPHAARHGQKVNPRTPKLPRLETSAQIKQADPPKTPQSQATVSSSDMCMQLGNISLRMRNVNHPVNGIFDNFTVSVASGSLLTIARTSLIESLDILNTKCLLQRNFIVEPLEIRCALADAAMVNHEVSDSRKDTFVVPAGRADSCKLGPDSHTFALSSSNAENNQVNAESKVATDSESGATGKHRRWFPKEHFLDLMHHLEKCFDPEMGSDDVMPLIEEKLSPACRPQALSLYEVIDSSGELGITEADLEIKLSASLYQVKPILRGLIRADAVFSVGGTSRRYVSRRHAKLWFVPVPAPLNCQTTISHLEGMNTSGRTTELRNKKVIYPCRMWRLYSGGLNCEGLQSLLQRLLSHLMGHPGSTLSDLCHMLNPDVLPSTTMEAIDILEEIGCLELIYMKKISRSRLFSARCKQFVFGDHVRTQESQTIIHATIEAPLKLAYFLDLVTKHCQSKKHENRDLARQEDSRV